MACGPEPLAEALSSANGTATFANTLWNRAWKNGSGGAGGLDDPTAAKCLAGRVLITAESAESDRTNASSVAVHGSPGVTPGHHFGHIEQVRGALGVARAKRELAVLVAGRPGF
jgi:hypothetical protein